ncbi:hypothetical protein N9850_09080 [Granulosicoccus sp.]|nr:hypothetical protein [Granulosicoccus sp.]MDB4223913.1 hypothetical protein [Granulosicoccus sp.]
MNATTDKINEEEYWENGSVGVDPQTVEAVSKQKADAIDDSMELQMISIRLNKSLLGDMKQLADIYGTGYQPLIREVLSRFAKGEKNRIYKDYMARIREEEVAASAETETHQDQDQQKIA